MIATTRGAVDAVRDVAIPIEEDPRTYDQLLDLIGEARIVLLGEASHGTHEFYQQRAEITKRLIAELGFGAVIAEADWPDAYRVNRYVRGYGTDPDPNAALSGFQRFPAWMWRNTVVEEFVGWLHAYNRRLPDIARRVGFYGMDLYSLYLSIEAVIDYLERVDPPSAQRARERYACFEFSHRDPQLYGYAASFGAHEPCEDDVVEQLIELQRLRGQLPLSDSYIDEDEFFYAEQNARVVVNAEEYYRSMFQGRVSSWNLRDLHMADTVDALITHLDRTGQRTRVALWAHNSHLGDARATEMGRRGELNVGQLMRERYGDDTRLIGFSTYTGTVTAASDWGAPMERMRVRPGLPGSFEELFHHVGTPSFMVHAKDAPPELYEPRLERAIGVIYRPESERWSHYFHAQLPYQFDAVLDFDETRALEPLDPTPGWLAGDIETYPEGV
jgi:erythromycin esterase-like protein